MDAKTFEVMLDRLGADFGRWPAEDAQAAKKLLVHSKEAKRAYDGLLHLESLIAESRPRFAAWQGQRVAERALAEISRRDASPSLIERFRLMLAAPLPRAAFAMSLTAIGFAIGIAVGAPATERAFETRNSGVLVSSADDVLF
jgi:hypothetical protein